MRPGAVAVRLMMLLCAAALLVPIAYWTIWVIAAAVLLLLAGGIAEWVILSRIKVVNERPLRMAISLGELESIPFSLTTNTRVTLQLFVRQLWPRQLEAASERRSVTIEAGEVVSFDAEVRAVSRGVAKLEPPHVSFTRWGLVERIAPAGEATELSVIPNTRAVARLDQQLNSYVLRGLGNRIAPRLGKGREFDRMRDYVTDDDYRDIAWRASARHNKLIVKEYRLDRSQEIILCVDRGHRMAARVGHLSRLDHAINATLLLSYLCNRMEDKTGVLSFADDVERVLSPARGTSHLRRITDYLTHVQPRYRFTDYLAVATNVRRLVHHRSLIVFFTVLPEPQEQHALVEAVRLLTPTHLPLVLVLTDPQLKSIANALPADKRELSRTLVANELWYGRSMLMKELRQRGAMVVETAPEDVSMAAVNAYIDVKRRQLL
jgi:uncharacterized protein (DUF58 family)